MCKIQQMNNLACDRKNYDLTIYKNQAESVNALILVQQPTQSQYN